MGTKDELLQVWEHYSSLGYLVEDLRKALGYVFGYGIADRLTISVFPYKDRVFIMYHLEDIPESFTKSAINALAPQLRVLAFWVGKFHMDQNPEVVLHKVRDKDYKVVGISIEALHPDLNQAQILLEDLEYWHVFAPQVIKDLEQLGFVIVRDNHVLPVKGDNVVSNELKARVKGLRPTCPICGEKKLSGRRDSKVCRACKDKFEELKKKAVQISISKPAISYGDFCLEMENLKKESDKAYMRYRKGSPWTVKFWDSVCTLLYKKTDSIRVSRLLQALYNT